MDLISQEEVVGVMGRTGLVAVFNHTDIQVAKEVLDACYNGGVRIFEFTNRGENALEVFEALVRHSEKYPDLVLGIGTIFYADDAKSFFNRGAQFIVSPAMIPEIANFCKEKNVSWIPGCGTVTEIHQALNLGAKVIKVFPGNVLGPGFVKSVKAVYPSIQVMPTGGVAPNEANLKEWFEAGVACVGMGSKLITQEVLAQKKFKELEIKVAETLRIISSLIS